MRRRDRPARRPRPKVQTLSDDEKKNHLAAMIKKIAASPVLTGLGLQVRSQRGRFYLERPPGEGDSAGVKAWGRVTPLVGTADLLMEHERRKGSWSEIARGAAEKLIQALAGDTNGDVPRAWRPGPGVATGGQGPGAFAGRAGG